ncbi:MAG TPA: ABC transporter permease [Holophagaceae bacterium]|nr:ABC transporter permease [Holophagaceae bacterium]
MTAFLREFLHALRALSRVKGFAAAAIVTLALGIGANTAVFSLLHTMVLTPLPFQHAEQVVTLWGTQVQNPGWTNSLSVPRLRDWTERNRTFEAVAGIQFVGMNLTGGDLPVRVQVGSVTQDFFRVIETRPLLGRTLQPSDPEGAHVVVLGEGVWKRSFGGDPSIVGKTIQLDGAGYTVVGVLPSSFAFARREAFVPHQPTEANRANRNSNYLIAFGRIKDGVSLDQARSDMTSVSQAIEADHPDTDQGRRVLITPYREGVYKGNASVLLLLGIAAGLVLLIACTNVANQLLARATGRMRDMAVRAALGGRTLQVLAPSLAESLLVSLLGAAAGLLVAVLALDLLKPLVPVDLVQIQPLGLHLPVLAMTLGTAVATALLCGSAPGLILVRLNLTRMLKDGSKGSDSPVRRKLRVGLVVLQMALALMLVAGFSVAYLSIRKLVSVPLGFETAGRSAVNLQPALAKYKEPAQRLQVARDLMEAVRGIPGVESAGYIDLMPTVQSGVNAGINFHARPTDATDIAEVRAVGTKLFATLGVPVLRGRDFADSDYTGTSTAVIVSDAFARKYFPGQDPVGQEVGFGQSSWYTIVGVAGDIRNNGPRFASGLNTIYFPDCETFSPQPYWIVMKSRLQGDALLSAVRAAVRRVDPDIPVMKVEPVDEIVGRRLQGERVQTFLLGLFAAIAAVLALLGVHSAMSYSVAQRTQEIGIRMSLGATPAAIIRMVVREGMLVAGAGIVLGLAGTFVFSKALQALLYGTSATDPLNLAAASALLLATAAAACFLPALRAARVHPSEALRTE